MGKEILMFSDTEIEKNKFYHHKSPIFLNDVNTEKVLVSKKFLLVKKTVSTFLVTCRTIIKLSHYT